MRSAWNRPWDLNTCWSAFGPTGEYPTEEQARWRIIELLEVGFRPRRVAALLAINPYVVYHWQLL